VWRLVAQREGQYEHSPCCRRANGFEAGGGLTGLVRFRRFACEEILERLFTSGEPALAENSPIQSIAITYPPRLINFAGMEWNWIILFFMSRLVAGFIFKARWNPGMRLLSFRQKHLGILGAALLVGGLVLFFPLRSRGVRRTGRWVCCLIFFLGPSF